MTLNEFKAKIAEMEEKSSVDLGNYEVVVITNNGGVSGGYPTTKVASITEGFDWNNHKILIKTKDTIFLDI